MFLGPTGVGKTELARVLAQHLFNHDEALIKLDMSEYMERFNVSRLVGAPPGYVGYEEGGELTERVRRNPFAVVLFDEIEKAHPDVFNVLLQIFDEGTLTDGLGRRVDFRNTVIIMTSNVGSNYILETHGSGEDGYQRMKEQVLAALRQHFRPEFLNRVDETEVFRSLTEEQLGAIAQIQVGHLQRRLQEQGITLELTEEAKGHLARVGYDPLFGARPLKRVIQKELENPIAKQILEGTILPKHHVIVAVEKDRIVFQIESPAATGEEGRVALAS